MAIPSNTVTMSHHGSSSESINMGIRSQDFKFLADVLNGLYSNVIAAPLREMSTNAWDSHVVAGVTRPIEITLPNLSRLELVIQDFGIGMNLTDLRETYAFYGASDKRSSNLVAGQLGLGSKSPLSYADGFTVSAVKDHEKVIAFVTKDDQGIGVIKILVSPHATDECDGVQVKIPVKRQDVDSFRREASNLFRFWEPGTVLVDGEAPSVEGWQKSALQIDNDTFLVRPTLLNSSYVIMGNVAYPVEDVKIDRLLRRFVARINIGDIDFVPSRENVKHTAHTDATLRELHQFIISHFDRVLSNAFSSVSSRWEETLIREQWQSSGSLRLQTPDHANLWTYTPSPVYGRRAAKSSDSLLINSAILNTERTTIITGYPSKNISASHRSRVRAAFKDSNCFIFLPKNTSGVYMLDKRPNTYSWDEIIQITSLSNDYSSPKSVKKIVETKYRTSDGKHLTVDELCNLSGKVLYIEHLKDSEMVLLSSLGSLGATVVYVFTKQIPRIIRCVPGIGSYNDEYIDQRRAVLNNVSSYDREIIKARALPKALSILDHTKINDVELADYIYLSKKLDTPALAAASTWGIHIEPTSPLPNYHDTYPLVSAISEYSLRNQPNALDEFVLYINASYEATHC